MKTQFYIPSIKFLVGDLYTDNSANDMNYFYLEKDKSLLYRSEVCGDYSILLGGNWRFELIVDSTTGLCVKFQSFLDELEIYAKSLTLPRITKRKVFIKNDDVLYHGEGCLYYPFDNKVYFDKEKNILCIGNPDIVGEGLEFTPQITMIVRNQHLYCMYLSLKDIDYNVFFKDFSV